MQSFFASYILETWFSYSNIKTMQSRRYFCMKIGFIFLGMNIVAKAKKNASYLQQISDVWFIMQEKGP